MARHESGSPGSDGRGVGLGVHLAAGRAYIAADDPRVPVRAALHRTARHAAVLVTLGDYQRPSSPSAVVNRPLGRYYMYFAHHIGHFIARLADQLSGPWKICEPGVLP
jgi:hypothetical protein